MVNSGTDPAEPADDAAAPSPLDVLSDGGASITAAVILARGVATVTNLQAAAAGRLESGAAAGARELALAADQVQESAHLEALLAALAGLDAVDSVVQVLLYAPRSGDGKPLLTVDQAKSIVSRSSEAAAQVDIAVRASGAYAMAAAANELAARAASDVADCELDLLATALAAEQLVSAHDHTDLVVDTDDQIATG